jgi:hypothetical protein
VGVTIRGMAGVFDLKGIVELISNPPTDKNLLVCLLTLLLSIGKLQAVLRRIRNLINKSSDCYG